MERSRTRTPIIQRSKGAATVGLVVTLGCALFGVGGAAAGDHSYAHHLRVERRMGALLAHRSPEQLVLAMTPKAKPASKPAPAPAPAPAATQTPAAPATPAPSTTATAITPQPATTTTAASTTTPATTTQTATTPAPANPTPTTTGTGAAPSGSTANVAAGATGNPATDGTGATGTTTTQTTPSPTTTGTTTTTPTTPGNDEGQGNQDSQGNQDNQDASGNGVSAAAGVPTPSVCHGRGCTSSQTGTVVPSALPAANSAASTGAFSVTNGSVPNTPSVTPSVVPTPVVATSTETLSPVTSTSTGTSQPPAAITLNGIPALTSGLGGVVRLTHGNSTTRSSAGTVIATAGTGAVTAATGSTGSATPTAGTAVAAAPTGTAAAHTGSAAKPKTHKHASSGGSSVLPAPINRVITQFVNVIPTAVWMALGAAFALALAFAALALRSSRRARRREREFVAISAAAATDALTGILNRRGFMDAAERELARASRYDRPFVLAYVDVRGLKAVNDTEGHLMGDELIQAVAGLMKESARADDVVGRIGGDEFALLLDEQTAESAEPVVRRIQARVEERRAAMEIRVPWELTIGIAAFPADGTTLEELLGTADRRLYEQRGIALR